MKQTKNTATQTGDRRVGMSLLELVIAMTVVGIMATTMTYFILTSNSSLVTNQSRAFAIQKAIAMMGELRAYAEAHESTGGASTLDTFDDGVNTSPMLTTDTTIVDPAHILSGNEWSGSRWKYARRISVRKFASFQESNVRVVSIKIYLTAPGANDASSMAEITSVISTQGENTPTTQVYDIYLLTIENIPGWWVYMAYLKPFVENAIGDMESRNPGMSYRTHWISKAAYGRDQEYKPYFNNAVDSNADINWVYFYPGSMPTGSAVNQYYIPGDVKARVNIDGATVNDYDILSNRYPYALADQYNHAMRAPDEANLYNARSNNATNGEELTYRLLLDDMISNPGNYRNAIILNLHGELLPMPSIRNYSDPAKDPANCPGWRVVTHPENISYTATSNMNLRVYAFTDTVVATSTFMTGVNPMPISIVISDANFTTAGDITVTAIEGGTDQQAPVGADTYVATTPALSGPSGNRMYCDPPIYDPASSATIIKLYNTPLWTPRAPVLCGLDTTMRLYGRDYIPCPVEAANDFSENLTSPVISTTASSNAPGAVNAGGALVYPGTGNLIYAFQGGTTAFWRYNTSTNSWTVPGAAWSTPAAVAAGGALVSTGNDFIYAFQGGTNAFWRYSISGNSWSITPATTPANVATGGALSYPGSGDLIYAFQGGTTAFWRYSISGNSWAVPGSALPTPTNVGAGGALVSTGNDFIYALKGGGTNIFWRYSISTNTWTVMAPTGIWSVNSGGSLAYPGSGDYIYAFPGNLNMALLRYSISKNLWTQMPNPPSNVGAGGSLVYAGSSDRLYGFRGNNSNTFWNGNGGIAGYINTARWIIGISAAAADREWPWGMSANETRIITIKTRIGEDLTTGTMWPPAARNKPPNLSTTYIYRYQGTRAVPFSECFQFQGDPRHCPYADVKRNHGYNWYFDNFRSSFNNTSGLWGGFTHIDSSANNIDGWHGSSGTNGDMMEIDVPRFFSFFKTALTGANCVYSTITGWSYYYMGLGNEIGYDSANGFNNSIPVSPKPFTGGSGTRWEDSITTAQTGGVKYIREKMTQYWWGAPWLGELYPDRDGAGANVYANQWSVNGNLSTPTGTGEPQAGKFVRIRRQDIQIGAGTPRARDNSLPRGTVIYTAAGGNLQCVRRTEQWGCTSLFNIGLANSTFRHNWPTATKGNITTAGQEIATAYNYVLPGVAEINRAFRLDGNWGGVSTEFNDSIYANDRCSSAVIARYYGHNDGAQWEGSSLVRLQNNPITGTPNAFVVVSGLAQTAEIGSAFISRYAVLSLLHGFLTCGIANIGGTPISSRISQLPRLEIKTPNVMTELDNPTAISITWSTKWERWDGQKYTAAYPGGYVEPGDDLNLKYSMLYSRDNGATWLNLSDNSPAIAGKPNQLIDDAITGGNEIYFWDVSDTGNFPEGSYIIMIEAYRNNQPCHYSYHQQRIYINR